ncbi:bifunctional 18S rRNA (guanine(1575)-N(7))-methyltransferase Bud23-like/S-adenosyl-L-methionine-dependent methyltransferase superfamily/Methyltransferase type 11 [Babesia duncani]|uniref:Bifunctional 18S rRNA (Guanine(1575)-N(7))-methyltransferase Bud23-like/S-adenosyl-L-methionine-dependent methyltransferase superfamily/Methyltransferase type 11 n=1 Tax=Babesia duncani TaxID=323732 RepID=A0AAD9PP18_9APIC|nr:bifunctional 18S rRNA (guanine(1575)-N(7))-methyltransferase Bud23-like/S-adenosyl-L-methionine-dependent methyltransferase superfamily/Methyltransferase type 11 [Babesia duncani]
MASRPEHIAPPEIYYDRNEARSYTLNSHIRSIQVDMSERALEMLLLPENDCSLVLDVGCGSGISGQVLHEDGNFWIGVDISVFMLDEALENGANEQGDMILADMGETFNFRPHSFDGAISISALQWLCVANKSDQEPYKRLVAFFKWLYKCLNYGARAALQFYPENAQQIDMIISAAHKCSFGGGLVVDFPDSVKAKKYVEPFVYNLRYYLCIWSGMTGIPQSLPQQLLEEAQEAETFHHNRKRKRKDKKTSLRSKILAKKEQQRKKVCCQLAALKP